jgi:DNA mismatch repair protein MutL
LFPVEIQFNQTDLNVLLEIQSELSQIGFELSFSDDSVFFTAIPTEISGLAPELVIHQLVDEYKLSGQSPEIKNFEKVARLVSRIKAQHTPVLKSEDALNFIIEKLFECKVPHTCPEGTKIVHILKLDELNNYFTTPAV